MKLMDILITAVNAVMPIILVILLGYLLKQSGFLSKDFVKTGNKLVFNVCLPCMLFINSILPKKGFVNRNYRQQQVHFISLQANLHFLYKAMIATHPLPVILLYITYKRNCEVDFKWLN